MQIRRTHVTLRQAGGVPKVEGPMELDSHRTVSWDRDALTSIWPYRRWQSTFDTMTQRVEGQPDPPLLTFGEG